MPDTGSPDPGKVDAPGVSPEDLNNLRSLMDKKIAALMAQVEETTKALTESRTEIAVLKDTAKPEQLAAVETQRSLRSAQAKAEEVARQQVEREHQLAIREAVAEAKDMGVTVKPEELEKLSRTDMTILVLRRAAEAKKAPTTPGRSASPGAAPTSRYGRGDLRGLVETLVKPSG